ncbi:hypothetical protein N5J29_09370 [Stenotrophomonas sp. GD03680]|nr:hypothetical protein [Stenotrophomonas sp. GD03680]MDH2022966.1 hypothetical protein [Stenotrophomonas sp. GD03680]
MKIPVFRSPHSTTMIADDLVAHGIVVVDTMRTPARRLAHELR